MPRFATAVVLSLSFSACGPMGDAWLDFGGVVTDPAGRPIQDARVSLMINGKALDHGGVATTDAKGHYAFHASSCPCDFRLDIEANAAGFRPYSLTLRGAQANRLAQQDITLVPR